MKAIINVKESSSKKWLIPLIILICSILFEVFLGNLLFYHSIDSINRIQSFLCEDIGIEIFNNSYTTQNNKLTQEANEIDGENNSKNLIEELNGIIIFSEVFHFFNSNWFYLISCIIIYNFVNTYKIYILINTIFLANLFSSTLCFIFHTPRPYMSYFSIKPVIMFNEWGSPNTQIVTLIAFLLVFYKVIMKTKRIERSLVAKIILFLIIIIIIISDFYLFLASGNMSYNQLIFSICIGVFTYLFIFLILNVDITKPIQLYNFSNFNYQYYLFINFILIAFQFILNIFIISDNDQYYYSKNIDEQQGRLSYSKFLNDYFDYRKNFYLNRGNFCNVICFSMNIVAFFSLKLEIHYTFGGDYEAWSAYNFESKGQEAIIGGEGDEYSIHGGTQWNHNGVVKGIVRIFVLIILSLLCIAPSIALYTFIPQNEISGYILIYIVPLMLLTFCSIYFFKVILRKMRLAKPTNVKKSNI
jgi:hypothetical protein